MSQQHSPSLRSHPVVAIGARLPVSHVAEAQSFYTEVFDFQTEFSDGSTVAVLRCSQGYVLLTHDPEPPPNALSMLAARTPAALLLVPFCHSVAERLRARGLHVIHMPEPPWGGGQVDFVDPFGNRVSMYSLGG
jgi:catechol 2,3-dioxygenase-like lactoylglutathione lyase family enzyme